MNLADCLAFAEEHPICHLATEDGEQPRVRPLLLWFADERGFYFMTMSPKELSAPLHQNPKVEVCFYNGARELPEAKMMRLTGDAQVLSPRAKAEAPLR